jgi:hypothetical protein
MITYEPGMELVFQYSNQNQVQGGTKPQKISFYMALKMM